MVHTLKIWKTHYDDILLGNKRVEIRREDDRTYNVGDFLELHVFDPEKWEHTGEMSQVTIKFIHRGLGMDKGYCALCISDPVEVADGL